jgi:hypothetical protein
MPLWEQWTLSVISIVYLPPVLERKRLAFYTSSPVVLYRERIEAKYRNITISLFNRRSRIRQRANYGYVGEINYNLYDPLQNLNTSWPTTPCQAFHQRFALLRADSLDSDPHATRIKAIRCLGVTESRSTHIPSLSPSMGKKGGQQVCPSGPAFVSERKMVGARDHLHCSIRLMGVKKPSREKYSR